MCSDLTTNGQHSADFSALQINGPANVLKFSQKRSNARKTYKLNECRNRDVSLPRRAAGGGTKLIALGAIPPRPPVAARAAGEAAGLDGSENSMDLNVPNPD